MTASANLIVAVLATSGFAALLGGLITGFFGRRKMSAETVAILSKTAGEQVILIREENERLHRENVSLKAQMDALSTKLSSTQSQLAEARDEIHELRMELAEMRAQLCADIGAIGADTRVIRHATEHPADHREGQCYED